MSGRIPFLRPNIVPRGAFEAYLDRIDETHLYSNYGPLNTLFEARVIQEIFQGHGAATTVNNATIGLMLAIEATKRPRAKYALMPSFTFAATPLAAQWCGLEPYFVDVRSDDWCMDQDRLAEALTLLGDQVAVVVPYATFGTAPDLDPYRRLLDQGIPVVLDAAPCFGTRDAHGHLGVGFPGLVVFSFHATKTFCVGEGGLVYSGDPQVIARIRQSGNFGFTSQRESVQMGLNSKVSEYTAAIALATLDAFPGKIDLHLQVHRWYLEELESGGLLRQGWTPQVTKGRIAFQFMPLLCPPGVLNTEVVDALNAKEIECRTYFSPACHQQAQFRDCRAAGLRSTEDLARRVLSLPLWDKMASGDVARVVRGLGR